MLDILFRNRPLSRNIVEDYYDKAIASTCNCSDRGTFSRMDEFKKIVSCPRIASMTSTSVKILYPILSYLHKWDDEKAQLFQVLPETLKCKQRIKKILAVILCECTTEFNATVSQAIIQKCDLRQNRPKLSSFYLWRRSTFWFRCWTSMFVNVMNWLPYIKLPWNL